ncbi:MAG: M20/M25/M40 family metallo-hydrolase [Candidatus Bathyarchaeia archaeon]
MEDVDAMGDYTRREAVDLLSRMISIYSPTGYESELANFIHSVLTSYGVNAKIDSIGNVVSTIGCGDPRILLCGHMDTIPGYIPIRTRGTRIYGRGAVDAKGPLASMISSFIIASRYSFSGTIILACVVDEEGESKGISRIIDDGIYADYAIFGEPSGSSSITIGYKGSMHVKLTAKSVGGHASAPWLYDNPLELIFEAYKSIKERIEGLSISDDRFYRYSVSLTMVKGGVAANVIPSDSEAYLDVRLPPGATPQSILEIVKQEALNTASKYRRSRLKVEVSDSTPPYEGEADSTLVEAFRKAVKSELGVEPRLIKKSGTSDMNIYANRTGAISVAYGPGNPRLSHRNIEWIEVEDYIHSIRILLRALSYIMGIGVGDVGDILT